MSPLLCCAAPLEARGLDLPVAVLGVGKAAAAMALARRFLRERPPVVLLFGVGGAYPARHRPGAVLGPGDLCVLGSDRFGDEGVLQPDGFRDLAQLGLGPVGPFAAEPELAARAAALLDAPIVRGCTVSTCSGTEAASGAMAARADADVETMEGAAVALCCAEFAVPLLQVRAISNWTGDRQRGGWDLPRALQAVQAAVRRLQAGLGQR